MQDMPSVRDVDKASESYTTCRDPRPEECVRAPCQWPRRLTGLVAANATFG
jgi:hypothetical protein